MDAKRLYWKGATLKRMISEAYRVQYAQVLGAPGWADTERYEVEAKAERPSTRDQFRQMLQSLFANGMAGGFSADVLMSIVIFLVWSFRDAQKEGIRNWWVVIPACLLAGLSLGLPIYLFLREQAGS